MTKMTNKMNDQYNLDQLATELLLYPPHTAIRFSFDGKSASYPMERIQAMVREWLRRDKEENANKE